MGGWNALLGTALMIGLFMTLSVSGYVQDAGEQRLAADSLSEQVLSAESTTQNLFTSVPDGQVASEFLEEVDSQLSVLPLSFQQDMIEDDLVLYVTDKDIDEVFCDGQYGSVQGVTLTPSYGPCSIYIEDREKAVENAPVHEVGHWYDFYAGFLSSSDSFATIYEEESDAFCQTFVVDFYYDKGEFFAEGFWKYWTEPDRLQASCPALFAYLDSYLSGYTS